VQLGPRFYREVRQGQQRRQGSTGYRTEHPRTGGQKRIREFCAAGSIGSVSPHSRLMLHTSPDRHSKCCSIVSELARTELTCYDRVRTATSALINFFVPEQLSVYYMAPLFLKTGHLRTSSVGNQPIARLRRIVRLRANVQG
jgi:hypothetical protein